MKVKEESEKAGLKFSIQKTKIMASGSTTAWQIDGETIGTAKDFIFLGSKITADGDCSREVKRRLLHGGKAVTNLSVQFSSVQSLSRVWLFATPWTNLYSILKSRDITLPTKVCLVKAMAFPIARKLSTEELMLLNCGVGEDSWESLGLQGDPTSQS